MPSRKKPHAKKSAGSYKIKDPKPVFIDGSLSEPDQCRQMCYQLAFQAAKQECQKDSMPFDQDTLDAIALETVRLCFQGQPASPGELAGLHPMMVTRETLKAAQAVQSERNVQADKNLQAN